MKFLKVSALLIALSFSCHAQTVAADSQDKKIAPPQLVDVIKRVIDFGVAEEGHFQSPFASPHSYILVKYHGSGEIDHVIVVSFESGSYYELDAFITTKGEVASFEYRGDISSPRHDTDGAVKLVEAPRGQTGTLQLGLSGQIIQLVEAPANAQQTKRKRGG